MTVRGRGSASVEAGARWFVGVRSRRSDRLRGSGGVEPGRPRPCRLRWPRTAPIPISGPPLPMRRGSLRPFSPDHRRCSGAGPAPPTRSLERTDPHRDTGHHHQRCNHPLTPPTVGTALSSAKCTSRRPGGGRGGTGQPVGASTVLAVVTGWPAASPTNVLAGPRRRRLSKSVAKAPIAPERRKRNVDIPRFFSPPIPVRSAFATDLDKRRRPRSSQKTHTHHPAPARPRHRADPGPWAAGPGEKGSLSLSHRR